ncbi:hypothetical protein DPMN_186043 [Dreissena polymorpha]|uniref:Uncharacterized protein n=1 Tax=Dreissena polymorpha TaxID=45954 RepID=A0A9D4DLL1_DREPO|nr:hypothetical protein DPMN_186043 [Dreissena polymorpha]
MSKIIDREVLTDGRTDTHTHTQTNRLTVRQSTVRHSDSQAGRQAGRQTDRHTDRQTKIMFQTIFAAMILIKRTPRATCQTAADVKALRAKLFDGYDYRVRPTDDQSTPTGSSATYSSCITVKAHRRTLSSVW